MHSRSFGEYGMNWGRKCVPDGEGVVLYEVLVDGAARQAVGVAKSEILTTHGAAKSTERSLSFSLPAVLDCWSRQRFAMSMVLRLLDRLMARPGDLEPVW